MTRMKNMITPSARQVKAARALLAWTQGELAREAGIATSTLADFERGERTPVANNVQAITAALEKQGIRFRSGGAVTGPIGRQAAVPTTGGQVLRWVTAEDLSQWAARRDGPAGLPELISRLIVVSSGPGALRFPADESIQHAGWDGICETNISAAFVDRRFMRISQEFNPGWSRVYARVVREGRIELGSSVVLISR